MPYEKVSGAVPAAYTVLVKPTSGDGFTQLGGVTNVYATKAEATQAAEDYMGAPTNGYQAVVMTPDPDYFINAE